MHRRASSRAPRPPANSGGSSGRRDAPSCVLCGNLNLVSPTLLSALQPTWDDLWSLAEAAVLDDADEPCYVFEDIGLILEPPLRPLPVTYDATPDDAVTFASTGGDGVHFSACQGAHGAIIVMTVPMQFARPNIVVGRTMREFLALGCISGYFGLEQLAYDFASASRALVAHPTPGGSESGGHLDLLRRHFQLAPWPDPRSRLDDLQALLPDTEG